MQTSDNILPAATGQDLGSASQQWDAHVQDLTVYRTILLSSDSGVSIDATEPRLKFNETDAAADKKLWDIDVNSNVFSLRTRTDADAAGVTWMRATRGTTTAISTVEINPDTTNTNFEVRGDDGGLLIGTDADQFGCGAIGLGGSPTNTAFIREDHGSATSVANQDFYKHHIKSTAAITIGTGTAAIVGSMYIEEPNITLNGNTVTDAYTLIIATAPTEGTRNGGLWVKAGTSRFDGTIVLGQAGGQLNATTSAYASGTAYTLTNSAAAVDFGTTDPSITIGIAGTYRITGRVRFDYVGATFAAVRTVTVKFRRTNNTAADLTNGTTAWLTAVVTTVSHTAMVVEMPAIDYTTSNTDDIITIFADVSTLPSAGSLQATEAQIIATRIR